MAALPESPKPTANTMARLSLQLIERRIATGELAASSSAAAPARGVSGNKRHHETATGDREDHTGQARLQGACGRPSPVTVTVNRCGFLTVPNHGREVPLPRQRDLAGSSWPHAGRNGYVRA